MILPSDFSFGNNYCAWRVLGRQRAKRLLAAAGVGAPGPPRGGASPEGTADSSPGIHSGVSSLGISPRRSRVRATRETVEDDSDHSSEKPGFRTRVILTQVKAADQVVKAATYSCGGLNAS